ncbi:MAG TPA: chemotaxis protein CheB [Niabella sp.]|nr:chemotaxis protein CheB [Niabella sp.]
MKNYYKQTGILLIGGSAGSIHVLLKVLPYLDTALSFPIVIVLHRKAGSENVLEELLRAYSSLPVVEAYDKLNIRRSCIYLAPPDYHLLFEDREHVIVDLSEKVNYSRPSIDVTFRSAAYIFKTGTTALLLSGANNDGVEGMRSVVRYGGTILLQDPDTAEVKYMPRQVLLGMQVHEILKPENMASFINQLNTKQ